MQQTVQLTVRAEGNVLATTSRVRALQRSTTDLARPNIMLLVHGFANSEKKAHSSYQEFIVAVKTVRKAFPDDWGAICEFHWPGAVPGHPIKSVRTYSDRIGVAQSSGLRLATFLNEDDQLITKPPAAGSPPVRKNLYIVAHSLGCRVVLEALKEIGELKQNNNYRGPEIRAVVLLAAAVPVQACVPGLPGSFIPVSPTLEYVFFSHSDQVLFWFFGPGQRPFGEPGHAVGRDGGPKDRWKLATQTHLGHGDYWKDRRQVAGGVSGILGWGPVQLPERHLPITQPAVAEPLPSRSMLERAPGRRK